MRIGGSLLLIALGAILTFAVADTMVAGVDLATVGIILMVVGAVGLILTLVLTTRRRRTDIVHQPGAQYVDDGGGRRAAPAGRTTYVEPADRDPRY